MNINLPIFERKEAGNVMIATLGLGPLSKRREGKTPRKVEQWIADHD